MISGETRRRNVLIGVLLVLVIGGLLTLWKDLMNGLSDKGFPDNGPRATMDWAKEKGVFVRECTIMPKHIDYHGQPLDFDSAWIERKVKSRPYYVWWVSVEKLSGYYLVVRCQPSSQPILQLSENFFVRPGAGNGFADHGTNSYDDDLTDEDYAKGIVTINLVSDFHAPRTDPISVTWKP